MLLIVLSGTAISQMPEQKSEDHIAFPILTHTPNSFSLLLKLLIYPLILASSPLGKFTSYDLSPRELRQIP